MQQYADIYLLQSHSTCFRCHSTHHPATTVTAASGTGHNTGTATSLQHPNQAMLEGSSCTSIMICTGSCGYSF